MVAYSKVSLLAEVEIDGLAKNIYFLAVVNQKLINMPTFQSVFKNTAAGQRRSRRFGVALQI
jgi:hypothetical protein